MSSTGGAPRHVLDEVDREVARRYPPGVRLLLDVVRAGDCGQHAPNEGLARVAQAQGEWDEDRASSDAFLDLAYALRNLSPDGSSNELCARALAEAWRREYPFRRGRGGDPLEVLVPQLDDARAARALDRARALPRPPVGLEKLSLEVEARWEYPYRPEEEFDRALVLAMLAEAAYALEGAAVEWEQPEERRRESLVAVLDALQWFRQPVLRYNRKLVKVPRTVKFVAKVFLEGEDRDVELADAERERLDRLDEALHKAYAATALAVGKWNDTWLNKYDVARKMRDAYARKQPGFPDPTGDKFAEYALQVEEVEAHFPGVELGLSAD